MSSVLAAPDCPVAGEPPARVTTRVRSVRNLRIELLLSISVKNLGATTNPCSTRTERMLVMPASTIGVKSVFGKESLQSAAAGIACLVSKNRNRGLMRRTLASAVGVCVLIVVASVLSAQQQQPPNTPAYSARCTGCHGADMTGASGPSIL